jgi:hypothetical protein
MRYAPLILLALAAPATAQDVPAWRETPPRYSSAMDRCAAEHDTSSPVCNAGCHYHARTVREDVLCDVDRVDLKAWCLEHPDPMFGVCKAADKASEQATPVPPHGCWGSWDDKKCP